MDLHIDVEVKPDLFLATMRGAVKLDDALRLLKRVCDMAAEDHIDKILVDCLAVVGVLAAFERYRLGAEMATYLTDRRINVRLAFVGVPPALNGFGALVAQNRGVDVSVFPTPQEALSWLEEPVDGPSLHTEDPVIT